MKGKLIRPTELPAFLAEQHMRRQAVAFVATQIALWWSRTRERRALAALNEHQLRDIGLTRADVAREIAKPFWRG